MFPPHRLHSFYFLLPSALYYAAATLHFSSTSSSSTPISPFSSSLSSSSCHPHHSNAHSMFVVSLVSSSTQALTTIGQALTSTPMHNENASANEKERQTKSVTHERNMNKSEKSESPALVLQSTSESPASAAPTTTPVLATYEKTPPYTYSLQGTSTTTALNTEMLSEKHELPRSRRFKIQERARLNEFCVLRRYKYGRCVTS